MGTLFRRLDQALHRAEQAVAGVLFVFMAALMFASVTHRVFSREEGRLSGYLLGALNGMGITADPAFVHGPVSALLNIAITFGLAYGALRTMERKEQLSVGRALTYAFGIALVLALAVKTVLWAVPNGIVWGPVVSLSAMLWVGFLGGSIATYEKRHLALEMGDKIWPAPILPYVRALAMLVTAGFCAFLLALSVVSLLDHHAGWQVNHMAGNLMPTEIPKWVVFLIFPYTFGVMMLRFIGAALGALRGEPTIVETLPGQADLESAP